MKRVIKGNKQFFFILEEIYDNVKIMNVMR